jgi:hypothetical protein
MPDLLQLFIPLIQQQQQQQQQLTHGEVEAAN